MKINEAVNIMRAYESGIRVQYKQKISNHDNPWLDLPMVEGAVGEYESSNFNFFSHHYRIHPEEERLECIRTTLTNDMRRLFENYSTSRWEGWPGTVVIERMVMALIEEEFFNEH